MNTRPNPISPAAAARAGETVTVTVTVKIVPVPEHHARARGRSVASLTAERADVVANRVAAELTHAPANVISAEYVPHAHTLVVEAETAALVGVGRAVDRIRSSVFGDGYASFVDWTCTD